MADIALLQHPTHEELFAQVVALLEEEEAVLTQLANLSALLYWSLPDVNWIGVYIAHGNRLHLGPFHGKPACTVIPFGSGVCGTAAAEQRVLDVPDVHDFPGHIACDAASNSEVVIPLMHADACWGVLDVDSPLQQRFTAADVDFFSRVGTLLESRIAHASGRLFHA